MDRHKADIMQNVQIAHLPLITLATKDDSCFSYLTIKNNSKNSVCLYITKIHLALPVMTKFENLAQAY